MEVKRKPSRIIYKYVKAANPTQTDNPMSVPPQESLASRAWTSCYQSPIVHFDLPSPNSKKLSSSTSSKSSSRSGSTSSSHLSTSSTSSHGCTKQSPPLVSTTRAHPSPAILTKSNIPHFTPSPPARPPIHYPPETSYTTWTTTITTGGGTFSKDHKFVSSLGHHDGVEWTKFRGSNWEYPLHKKVQGKKVLASYPHCQTW